VAERESGSSLGSRPASRTSLLPGVKRYPGLLRTLGPYKTGASCLCLRGLDGVHLPTPKQLIKESVEDICR